MPALSPTMTEGNIASWKVKEGESFSAGDVLLEIETDKATMDVEAQDDGVMFKITTGDGAKAVEVGTRIAVIAEPGDDLSSLEIPADDKKASSSSAPKPAENKEAPKSDTPERREAPQAQAGSNAKGGAPREQRYPLYPSVQHLVNEHGLDKDVVSRIEPTGPGGRLLKGDVLAYLGSINAETPSKIMDRAVKMSHLDLSNIKVAPKKAAEAPKKAAAAAPAAPAAPVETEIALPVSLAKVLEAQKRIQSTLGVFMPVSTFVARAAEVANDDLPPSARKPTADELFNQVLGLDKLAPHGTRGYYLPQISALPEPSFLASAPPRASPRRGGDIIDLLAAPKKASAPAPKRVAAAGSISSDGNLFSLTVPRGDEKRAKVFLERVKIILEEEPARLVL
ncbi:biotin-requiring enzyme [Colletotrichum karsti]|uniref:Biotin-requiring enzyme n=1 Tax=Colletotrichum karsti TaxID=1095194 RepID=A0A9P6LHW6_9PEZI|nr:biotin-requiring enzyme [Colletotrichum karsti]KAF9874018.1 biotin-requiring enzyme [Colletotrichum karsti]